MNKTLKSILSLVLCVCFVLALSACGKQNNDTTANNTDTNVSNNNVTDDNTDDSADITPEESTAGDSNILVAYFSWSGNTQQVANWISDKTGGELFRIIPEVEYTEDDVFDRAQDELNNGTRPPLSSHIDQEVMEQYDVIFVGFPFGGTTCQCLFGLSLKNMTCPARQLFRFLPITAVRPERAAFLP